MIQLCDFGCNQPAIKQFKSGKNCCSASTSSCPAMKSKNNISKAFDINWQQIQKDYDNGLSHRDIVVRYNISMGLVRSAINKKLLTCRSRSEANKVSRQMGKGCLSKEAKIIVSDNARKRILQRYEQGWMPKAGRCKKYKYVSHIAGTVLLDGTWELAVAKWLDSKNYQWKRNTKRFPYLNLKNKLSFYTPDFWVKEFNSYLEIKGYITELDRCKWRQFTESLIVWTKKDLIMEGCLSG